MAADHARVSRTYRPACAPRPTVSRTRARNPREPGRLGGANGLGVTSGRRPRQWRCRQPRQWPGLGDPDDSVAVTILAIGQPGAGPRDDRHVATGRRQARRQLPRARIGDERVVEEQDDPCHDATGEAAIQRDDSRLFGLRVVALERGRPRPKTARGLDRFGFLERRRKCLGERFRATMARRRSHVGRADQRRDRGAARNDDRHAGHEALEELVRDRQPQVDRLRRSADEREGSPRPSTRAARPKAPVAARRSRPGSARGDLAQTTLQPAEPEEDRDERPVAERRRRERLQQLLDPLVLAKRPLVEQDRRVGRNGSAGRGDRVAKPTGDRQARLVLSPARPAVHDDGRSRHAEAPDDLVGERIRDRDEAGGIGHPAALTTGQVRP